MNDLKHALLCVLTLTLSFCLLSGCAQEEAPPAPGDVAEAPVEQPPAPAEPAEPLPEAEPVQPAVAGDPIAAMEEPPPLPKGYETTAAVMAAIAQGEVELLDANVEVPDGVKEAVCGGSTGELPSIPLNCR